jgi:glc operon protein GlcG
MKLLPSLALALALFGSLSAEAQVLTKPTVGLQLAKKIAAKAEAEAAQRHWTMCIVIVNDAGRLVYLETMDGTQVASIRIAQEKAETALQFKRPTKVFEQAVAQGRTALVTIPGLMAIEGGVPLTSHGACIGAIGVSGMRSDQDGVVADLAAKAFSD